MEAIINSFHHLPHRNFTTKFSQLKAAAACVETSPPPETLSNVSSLSKLKLNPAKARHAHIIKMPNQQDSDIKVQSLITSYLELGDFHSAAMLFFVGLEQNYLHWNTFFQEFKNKGGDPIEILQVFVELHNMGVVFGSENLAMLLKMCAKLRDSWLGLEIHVCLIKRGFDQDMHAKAALMNFYGSCWGSDSAKRVFDETSDQTSLLWNEAVLVALRNGEWFEGIDVFRHSQFSSMKIDSNTFTIARVLQACGKIGALDEGKQIHGYINLKPDTVTWNTLLSGHLHHGSYQEVLNILQHMQNAGFKPNNRSVTTVLQAASELHYQYIGKEIHCYVIRNGLDSDIHVVTSLLDMYVKNDDLNSAQTVFDGMECRNIFAWNAMISGYSFKGDFEKAASLMSHLKGEGVRPDLVTYNSMVSGYSMAGRIDEALDMMKQIKDSGLAPNVVSWTALISGSCQNGYHRHALDFCYQMQAEGVKPNSATIASLCRACAGLSLSIFRATERKTLASWNSMIMGFSSYGHGKKAISLFHIMQQAKKLQPDAITMTALLTGCKHSGLIDEGWRFFDSMETKYGITPTIQHYSCMVDLLARAGYLDEAWDFISQMPVEPDSTVWGAILGSCRTHGSLQLGEIAARQLFKLEPQNPANYVLLMNMYAASERWDDVDRVRDLMERRSLKIGNVWSWIEMNNTVHVFSDTKCVHLYTDDKGEKEKALLSHTEKRAITFGLIKTKTNTPVRVIKNTTICGDCHTFAEYTSLARKREIILKDGIRFHHFKEGKCSCRELLESM